MDKIKLQTETFLICFVESGFETEHMKYSIV